MQSSSTVANQSQLVNNRYFLCVDGRYVARYLTHSVRRGNLDWLLIAIWNSQSVRGANSIHQIKCATPSTFRDWNNNNNNSVQIKSVWYAPPFRGLSLNLNHFFFFATSSPLFNTPPPHRCNPDGVSLSDARRGKSRNYIIYLTVSAYTKEPRVKSA